jgi:hypothetical protein
LSFCFLLSDTNCYVFFLLCACVCFHISLALTLRHSFGLFSKKVNELKNCNCVFIISLHISIHLHLSPRFTSTHIYIAWCLIKHTYFPTHIGEPFLMSRQLCSHSRTTQHFMESEVSIPCSQQPSIGAYPEPYGFIPHHPILSI